MKRRFTKLLAALALLVGLTIPYAGEAQSSGNITLTATSGFASAYSTNHTFTVDGIGFKDSGVMYNSKGSPNGFAVKQVIQMRKSGSGAGEIYNTTAISTISSIEVTLVNNKNGFSIYYGTTENPTTSSIASSTLTPTQGTFSYTNTNGVTSSATSYTFTFDLSSYNATYFKIVNGSSANYVGSIVINYESGTLLDNEVTLNPTSLALDMNVNSTNHTGTITCTTSCSGAISVSENAYVSTLVSGNTITVTPLAVTTETQTLTVTQASDGTYAEGTAEFTVTVVNTTPTVTVTYHAGVTGVADVVETPFQGSDYPVADNTFTYEGHAFTGWKDGNNNEYAPGYVIQAIANNYDMYAQWVETHEVSDVLNREFTGIEDGATTYGNWSGKTGVSGAVYAGNSAGSNNAIQLRSKESSSGIVTTVSAGNVAKVTVTWNDNTMDDRILQVYGKNTAYDNASDLYNDTKKGDLLGEISKVDNQELTIVGNYAFIGLRSKSGAMYITEIDITWSTSSTPDPSIDADDVEIAYDDEEGEIEFEILYGVDGGTVSAEVIGTPTIVNFDLGDETTSPISFTCDANNSNTDRTATVRLTYTYNIDNTTETKTKEVTITQTGNPDFVNNISDIISSGTNYRVKGTVVAKSNNGFVIGDNTGYVYTYKSTSLSVGDKVILAGTTGNYNHVIQFTNNVEITTTESSNYNGTPAVTVISEVPDYTEGLYLSTYFQYEGVLSTIQVQSGNNTRTLYLVAVGQSHICISYPSEAQIAAMDALLGKTVRVKGYFSGYNSNDYFTTLMESVEEVSSETIELAITGYTNGGGWNLIASPVSTSTTPVAAGMITDTEGADATTETATYDLYSFNQSAKNKEWVNYRQHQQDFSIESGTGYLYANKNDVTLTFTGTPIEGTTKEIPLVKDDNAEFPGWNLVGNPFNSNATLNMGCYTISGNAINMTANTAGTYTVAPCEGVMVKATAGNQTVTFTKATQGPSQLNQLEMTVAQQVMSRGTATSMVHDNAIVNFNAGSQLEKFPFNADAAELYIPQDGKDYAIVSSEAQGEMPVNFKAKENGTYTLSINVEGVEMNYLHLIDNKTGNDIDLLQTPSYSFEAKTTDYESRFKLVFVANNEESVSAGSETFAFFSNGSFVINNEGNAELQVIDITGRIVKSESINGCANVNVNAAPGVYMLRLVNGDNVKVQKVVVK